MHCICTFLDYQPEALPKQCFVYTRSREAMLQSGTGFKNVILKRYHQKEMKIEEYIVDETLIKVGSELVWLWVAIEPENRQILALSISKERNMLIAERFLSGLVKIHGKHPSINRRWNLVPNGL